MDNTHFSSIRRVSRQEFRQALQQAGYGLGAGCAFKYDAQRDETTWTVKGQSIGLTVGLVGSTSACYLTTAGYPLSQLP